MIDYVMQNDGLQRQKKFAEITFESTPNRPQFIRPSAQLEKKNIWDILKKSSYHASLVRALICAK
jgi:hypothetical protein